MGNSINSTIVNSLRALPDYARAVAAVLWLMFLDAVRRPKPRRRASDWRRD